MSLSSSAEIIPFERFLDWCQRLHQIAAANGTVVMPRRLTWAISPKWQEARTLTWRFPRCITDRPRGDAAWRQGQV